MRFLLCAAAATAGTWLALASPVSVDAQTAPATTEIPAGTNDSAYGALRLVGKTLGKDALDRVVEVTGRDGNPQPYTWKITLSEPAGGTREVEVAGGKIAAQRTDPKPAGSRGVIHLSDLNLDSSGAFDATDAQARKVHLRFDSVNYVLRPGEASGKPHWTLNLFNQTGGEVGAMRLGASDGNILSIDGRLAAAPTPTATPRPSAVAVVVRPTPGSHAVESRTTVTATTTTASNPPPPPPPPVPPPAATTETVTVDTPAPDQEGGLFTRTGRTLDKTSHDVASTLDRTGHNVTNTLRHTGATLQRFFTGHSDIDQDAVPPPPPAPPPPRDPNFRGD